MFRCPQTGRAADRRYRPSCEVLEGRELPSLTAGMPFRVNTVTTGDHEPSAVAGSSNGTAVVAWLSSDKNALQIQAQRFDAQGHPLGGPITVASSDVSAGAGPKVASDGQGDFVVVWETSKAIVGERFGAAGQRLGKSFTVARITNNASPSVAMDNAGAFVITYSDNHGSAQAQLYRADGRLQRSLVVARSRNMQDQWIPTVAMSPSGRFDVGADDSVVFADAPQMTSDTLWIYRYAANGTLLGATRVLHSPVDNQGYMDVQTAIDAAGNGAIAFSQGNGIIAVERVSAAGKRLGQGQVRPTSEGIPIVDAVALSRSGGQVLVAWEAEGGSNGFLAEVDSQGTSTGQLMLPGTKLGLATVGQAAFLASYSAADPSVADNPKGKQVFGETGTY